MPSMGSPEHIVRDAAVFRRELVAFASRQLGDHRDAADDVVQDAYLHLLDRARAGTPPDYPRGWLYAVVRTRCRDERIRRGRERAVDLDETPGTALGPEDSVIAAAEGRWMLAQVAGLPESEREAVVAHLAGVSGAAASDRGRSANAVHQALFRGRARLRKAHEGLWGALVFPARWCGSSLRRAMGSPISPSAFKGGAGVVRAAVIGGTALATTLGAGPLVHLTNHLALGSDEAPAEISAGGRPAALGDFSGGGPSSRQLGPGYVSIVGVGLPVGRDPLAGIGAIQGSGQTPLGPAQSTTSGPTVTDTTPTSTDPTVTDTTPTSTDPTVTDTPPTSTDPTVTDPTPTSTGPTVTDTTPTSTDPTVTDTTANAPSGP